MIVQGLNNLASSYGSVLKSPLQRQSSAPAANLAERVSISDAARVMLGGSQGSTQEAAIQQRIDAIKAKPAVERVPADFDYLLKNDTRFAEIQEKMKVSGNDSLTADEVDYLQKAGGFVNTMAELSPGERALYDELVAKGNSEAAHGLLLVGMSRIGMGGQQVTLPNGQSFDPTKTEVTAANIRNLFKFMFVDGSGSTDRQFDALAAYLDKREASAQSAGKA